MEEITQVIIGIVALVIGIILLFKHKIIAKMTIESQKGVDRVLGKEQDYNRAGLTLMPKIVILLIGIVFCIFGILAILTNFVSFGNGL